MNDERGESLRRSAQLDQVIAEYIELEEAGRPPDRGEFQSRYPDLAAELRRFFADQDGFERCLPRQANTDPFPVPYRLGRIELQSVIGRGAFGTVYRGWDAKLERQVAVKVLRIAPHSSPEIVNRALREARIAARLTHPGIVSAHDVGESAGLPYLVSEYVAGRTLAELIRDNRPVHAHSAVLIAAVADALHHAHEEKVVHRDVKPSNIMLRDERTPLLTDFGLALWHTGDETLTADGRIVGTVSYMSPEQARGEAVVDRRSDVYSLGVMLYELLTGERPFVGNVQGMLHQIEHDDPRSPKRLDDRVPRDLETVCLRCLQKEPSRRYATAAALADDLRRFLAGEPVHARPVGRAERLIRWARKNPWLAAAGTLAAMLIVATVWVSVAWALDSARQAKEIRSALDESRRVTAETEFDGGLAEAERGDVALGLLWMARSLETASDPCDRTWAVRANLTSWRRQLITLTDCKEAPPGRVLAFAPDGRTAWFVEADELTVRCWDLNSARVVGVPLAHPAPGVHCAAVTPDGARIACGTRSSGVYVWQAASGKLETSPSKGSVRGVAYSADGRELIFGLGTKPEFSSDTAFWVWDGGGLREVAGVSGGGGSVAIAAGSDGRTLLTAGQWDREIRRWDTAAGELREQTLRHQPPIKALAISRDGRHVLTGGDDRSARLWDAATGQLLGVLYHRTPVTAVAFGPDGKTLLTASLGDAIRVWAVPPEAGSAARETLPARVRAVAFSPDGGLVATGSDDSSVRVWKITAGRLEACSPPLLHPQPIRSVSFSADGRTLAVIPFIAPGVHLWNPITGERTGMLLHPSAVKQVCAGPGEKRVVTVGYSGDVRVWDGWTGLPSAPHALGAEHQVCAVDFRPSGRELVAATHDGRVHRWSLPEGALIRGEKLHAGPIGVVRSHPSDANTLLTADDAGVAQLWDAGAFAPSGPTLDHGFAIAEAVTSPDGRIVLTGGVDGKTRIWDTRTGREIGRPLRHGGRIRAVAVSPGGRWVVTASDDGTARVWAVPYGRPLGPPIQHGPSATCAAVAPDDRWIVTGGGDQSVRLLPAPAELNGEPGRIAEWVRVATGAELDPRGDVRTLTPADWRRRSDAARLP